MPYYQYQCQACKHSWEQFQKIDNRDLPLTEGCPDCKSTGEVSRGVSAPRLADPYRTGGTQSSKLPGDMKEIFQRIGESNYGSELHTKYA